MSLVTGGYQLHRQVERWKGETRVDGEAALQRGGCTQKEHMKRPGPESDGPLMGLPAAQL